MLSNFYGLNGHFPTNYKVSATIDVSKAQEGCAGLSARQGTKGNFLAFVICPDGYWAIILDTTSFKTLADGSIQANNSYSLTASSVGDQQSLIINGTIVKTVTDGTLTITDHLSLFVGIYNSTNNVTALFSNFVFTPLP